MSKESKNTIPKKITSFKNLKLSFISSLLILLTVLPTIFWISSANKNYKYRIQIVKLQKENQDLKNKVDKYIQQQSVLLNETINLQSQIDNLTLQFNNLNTKYNVVVKDNVETKKNVTSTLNTINKNLRNISVEIGNLKKKLNSNRSVRE